MTPPAVAGQHHITENKPPRRWPWTAAITGSIVFALLVAVAHYSQFGPGIDNAVSITDIGKYLCEGNQGLRRITLRAAPNTYTFTCRDGALHPDVRINVAAPQS